MQGAIAVQNLQSLSNAQTENMREITATALVQDHGRGGNRKLQCTKTAGNINEDIAQSAVGIDNDIFRCDLVLPIALAPRIFATGAPDTRLRQATVEGNASFDHAVGMCKIFRGERQRGRSRLIRDITTATRPGQDRTAK